VGQHTLLVNPMLLREFLGLLSVAKFRDQKE
jgi:hypothetical protein